MKAMAAKAGLLSRVLLVLALGVVFVPGSVAQQSTAAPEATPAQAEVQRQQSQPGNNAPVWREVRKGGPQYTSIPGRETNVLIQTYGQTWRELRNGPITFWGGWLVVLVVVALGLFYQWKGPIPLRERPTGRLIERFSSFERIAHWTMAISFCILAISGLIILFGKHVLLPVIGYTLFAWLTQLSKHLHNFVGPIFIFSILVSIVAFIRDNLPSAGDIKWLATFGGMFSGKEVPAGRFNAGQKGWFWIGVAILGIVMSASGLVLDFPNFDQTRAIMIDADVTHSIGALLFIAAGLGHIYIGTIGMVGAYDAMRHGYVDEAWAKEHHELWYNDVKSGKVKAGSAIGMPAAPQAQH